MSDEGTDLKSTFLAVFDAEDVALFKSQEKEVKKTFIKNALLGYRLTKKRIEKKKGNSDELIRSVLFEFSNSAQIINEVMTHLRASKEPMKVALRLGQVLGQLLGAVRFGLTNHLFDPSKEDSGISSGAGVLAATSKIVTEMKTMHKKIKPQFIARQVSSIAKEHAGKLTKEQKELLAKVAAMFASI